MSKERYKFNRCKSCLSQVETINTVVANWILPEGKHILLSKYLHKEKLYSNKLPSLRASLAVQNRSLSLRFLQLCLY